MLDISNQVIQDLRFLSSLGCSTASEFCKLVLNQFSKLYLLEGKYNQDKKLVAKQSNFGVSQKILESAAKKLSVSNTDLLVTPEKVASTLQAIAHLYVESAKRKLSPDALSIFLADTVISLELYLRKHNFPLNIKLSH